MSNSMNKEKLSNAYVSTLCAEIDADFETIRYDADSCDALLKKIVFVDGQKVHSSFHMQLKSTNSKNAFKEYNNYCTYDLKVKNYNDLCLKRTTPLILGILVLPKDSSDWVNWSPDELLIRGKMYYKSLYGQPLSDNTSTVTIYISKTNVLNSKNIDIIFEKVIRGDIL